MQHLVFLIILAVVAFVPGCAPKANPPVSGNASEAESANLLANPGFELGLMHWQWLDWSKGWAPFALSQSQAHGGTQSLHLPVTSMDARPTIVWGGVQELVLPDEIPECIDGYYYVENWERGAWKQYLQFVVIDLSRSLGEKAGNAQLRYVLTGSSVPPLQISNAQYLFAERSDTPTQGKWVHFALEPRRDFRKQWQYVPQKGAQLRLLFEARFDGRPRDGVARADVYYDDLYFGPKTETRCGK